MKKAFILLLVLNYSGSFAQSYDPCSPYQDGPSKEKCYFALKDFKQTLRDKGIDPKELFKSQGINTFKGLDEVSIARPLEKKACKLRVECRNESLPLMPEYTDFLFSFTDFARKALSLNSVSEDCSCLKQNLQSDYAGSFDDEFKKTKESVNKKILEAYSKKFLNDFSSNMEDASFFLTKNRHVFSDQEQAKKIQCNDAEAFNKKVDAVCEERSITDREFIEKRKNFFINSLDGGSLPFEKRLESMSAEIQTLHSELTGRDFTRFEYDNSRMGLAHNNPLGKIADHILKNMLSSHKIMKKINPHLGKKATPVEVVMDVFVDNKGQDDFIEEIRLDASMSENVLGDEEGLKNAFRFLMNTHPGFLNSMADKETFKRLAREVTRNPQLSVLDVLETRPVVLEPLLYQRCEQLITNLAKAVCIKDDNLFESVDPQDLQRLVTSTLEKTSEHQFSQLLYCDRKSASTDGGFKHLANLFNPNLPAKRSDFLERLLEKDLSKHKNMFTRTMMSSSNEEFRKGMAEAAENGKKVSVSVDPGGVVASKEFARSVVQGKAFSFGKPAMEKKEAEAYLEQSKRYEIAKAGAKLLKDSGKVEDSKIIRQSSPAILRNVSQFARQPDYDRKVADVPSTTLVTPAKVELSKYLSRSNRPEEIKKKLDQLDYKNVESLNQIRTKDRSTIAQSILEEEKRLKDMQVTYRELEEKLLKKAQFRKPASKQGAEERETGADHGSQVGPGPQNNFSPLLPKNVQRIRSSVLSGGTQLNSSSSLPKEEVTSNTVAPSTVKRDERVEPDPGLLITVPHLISGETSETIINQEIRKYIENSTLNASTVDELREKGIVIRFLTIENNREVQKEFLLEFDFLDRATKRIIEHKLAKKGMDIQVSKLAILKMLINQTGP